MRTQTPNLDAARRRDELAQHNDAARLENDRSRYENGERGAPMVGAVMSTYTVLGENALAAQPHHNEMPLGIVEQTASRVMFLFDRKMGHASGHGVRMVTLELVSAGLDAPAHWRVAHTRFVPR